MFEDNIYPVTGSRSWGQGHRSRGKGVGFSKQGHRGNLIAEIGRNRTHGS